MLAKSMMKHGDNGESSCSAKREKGRPRKSLGTANETTQTANSSLLLSNDASTAISSRGRVRKLKPNNRFIEYSVNSRKASNNSKSCDKLQGGRANEVSDLQENDSTESADTLKQNKLYKKSSNNMYERDTTSDSSNRARRKISAPKKVNTRANAASEDTDTEENYSTDSDYMTKSNKNSSVGNGKFKRIKLSESIGKKVCEIVSPQLTIPTEDGCEVVGTLKRGKGRPKKLLNNLHNTDQVIEFNDSLVQYSTEGDNSSTGKKLPQLKNVKQKSLTLQKKDSVHQIGSRKDTGVGEDHESEMYSDICSSDMIEPSANDKEGDSLYRAGKLSAQVNIFHL